MRLFKPGLLSILTALGICSGALADDNRPVYIEITELEHGHYQVGLRLPSSIPSFNQPDLIVSGACSDSPLIGSGASSDFISQVGMTYRIWQCEEGLSGQTLKVQYPQAQPALPTVLRVSFFSGQTHTQVLAPGENQFLFPEAETKSNVARDYLRLGIHHIWAGTDHLLFVLCLIFIAASFRRILVTITGFTLAHSITLALSALEVVHLRPPPIEALIALSVVFLATEVCKGRRENLTWRFPFVVSIAFGLLHGLGFAAALNQIGLPNIELVTGLLFFNLGVEVGQVLFVILIVVLLAFIKKGAQFFGEIEIEQKLQRVVGYAAGCLATLWFFERVFS